MNEALENEEIARIVEDLHPRLRELGSEWFERSLVLCLRHLGRCAYCGLDLLASRGVCYHLWCHDHLLPQGKYPELKERPENLILACKPCNNLKGDYDPNEDNQVYFKSGALTQEQRAELFARAKTRLEKQNAGLAANFEQELQLLRPYINRA